MKPEPIEIEDSPPRPGQVVQLKKPKQVVAEPPKEASTAGYSFVDIFRGCGWG